MPFGKRDHTPALNKTAQHAFLADQDTPLLFQSLVNGLALVEGDRVTYANRAFRHIFGMDDNADAMAADLPAQWTQANQTVDFLTLLSLGEMGQLEFHASATGHWYGMTLSPASGHRMILVCTDITAFRRRDELLSSANKMEALGQLAGGVAHDFNNLLSIIQGYARMAMKHADANPVLQGQLERIIQSVQRGAGLTRQLLTFGRNKIVAEGSTHLCRFLDEQRNLLMPLLDARIQLIVDCPHEDLHVAAHADMIAQILLNAVTNARDAMEESGGQIMIVAGLESGMATLAIHDTGAGMDEATRKRAMEPFFTTKPADKGTGLGLSQIYGLLQQIGGEMTLFSEPGRGTSLILKMPLSQEKAGHKTASQKGAPLENRGQTILLVDDEPDLVVVMQNILEEKGFKVLTAGDGNEALALQDDYEGPIHWLLSDVVMGDMSGPKLGSLVESVRSETRMIYMSGYPATGRMARIQLPDDAVFMAKPIDPAHLWDIMDTMQKNEPSQVEGLVRLAGGWTQQETRSKK